MKNTLYKLSALLPLSMVYFTFVNPLVICSPRLRLFLEPNETFLLTVLLTVTWLCCSPLRKTCCNGSWTELLFNLVPVEIILMLFFAQRYLFVSVILALLLLAGLVALFIDLRKDACRHRQTKKSRQAYRKAFCKCSVLLTTALCIIPCLMVVFVYGFETPVYQAEQEILEQLFADIVSYAEPVEGIADPVAENEWLWKCFEYETWDRWSVEEKMAILQTLTDYETETLGIPAVAISAGMIGEDTLGAYNYQTNEMWINTEHLVTDSAEECIDTVCHEAFHACQHYIVASLDWDNPALQTTSYFSELRAWLINEDNYMSAEEYGYDIYADQPIEASARAYADKETARIMKLVELTAKTSARAKRS